MPELPSKKVLAEMTAGTVAASALAALAVYIWRQRTLSKKERLEVLELLRRVVATSDGAEPEDKQLREILEHMRRGGLYTPEMTDMLQELAEGSLTDDRGLGLEILLRELGFMLRQRNM